jgi:SH3-like domain-containing protein
MSTILRLLACFVFLSAAGVSQAQDREVPYWASLRADEVNMRVGPSQDYQVDWVYKRKGLPVKVVRVVEGWRLVQDPDGTQGWIVARLLNPQRTAIVAAGDLAGMYEEPNAASKLKWNLEPGVVGILGDCDNNWCQMDVDGRRGWVNESRLWGTGAP